jgi:hypothetical protein
MSIAISDGTNTITFAPDGPYRLTVDNLAIVANGGARILRVIPRTTNNPFVEQLISGELQWTLHVKVWGTDADDLAQNIKNLSAILTAPGTLTDQLDGGASPVTYVRNPSLPIRPVRQLITEPRHVWEGDVLAYTTVIGAGSAVTLLTTQSLALPGVVALGSLVGDAPAPLTLEIDAAWDTTSNGMKTCVLAVVPGDATIADYLMEAEDATGWAMGTGENAGPAGSDNNRKTTSATWDDLNFGVIAAGRYRVIARAHRQSGASGYLALSEDGATAYQVTALTGEDYHLYDLGEFDADGVVSLHVLGMTDTGQVNLDWLCLFPVETAYVLYDCTDWHVDSWQLGDVCTLTGTGGNVHPAAKYMVGSRPKASCAGQALLIAACDENGTEAEPDIGVTVSASYVPQHYSWASA